MDRDATSILHIVTATEIKAFYAQEYENYNEQQISKSILIP